MADDVKFSEAFLYSEDGQRLYTQRWEPSQQPMVCELLIIPGYADHGRRYEELALFLARSGIASLAVDLRGHGRSEGRRGFVKHYSDYRYDVRAAYGTLPTKHPRFLLGHSQGGLVALDVLAHEPLAASVVGAILTSPFLGLKMAIPGFLQRFACRAATLLPTLRLPSGLSPDQMSHDIQMVDAYRHDPLVFRHATLSWFREALQAQQRVLSITALAMPLLFYYSSNDPVADGPLIERFASRLSCLDKTMHDHKEGKHELLNEIDRQTTFAEIRDWILQRSS